jgi:hypothetical protein
MPVYPGAPHRQKRPTRLRSPKEGPYPGSPDRRPGPGRTLRDAFSCRDVQGSGRIEVEARLARFAGLSMRQASVLDGVHGLIDTVPAAPKAPTRSPQAQPEGR